MIYKTSLDKLAKGITIGVTILFAVIIIGQYSIIKNEGRATTIYTTAILLLIYFIAFAFRPITYEISADKLTIHRLFLDVKINLNQIKSVELLNKEKQVGLSVLLVWVDYLVIMENLQIQKLET